MVVGSGSHGHWRGDRGVHHCVSPVCYMRLLESPSTTPPGAPGAPRITPGIAPGIAPWIAPGIAPGKSSWLCVLRPFVIVNAIYDTGVVIVLTTPLQLLRTHIHCVPTDLSRRATPCSAQSDRWLPRCGPTRCQGTTSRCRRKAYQRHRLKLFGTASNRHKPTALCSHGPQLVTQAVVRPKPIVVPEIRSRIWPKLHSSAVSQTSLSTTSLGTFFNFLGVYYQEYCFRSRCFRSARVIPLSHRYAPDPSFVFPKPTPRE